MLRRFWLRSATPNLLAALLALVSLAGPARSAGPAQPPGSVLASFPPQPDPSLRYVVYLHGRIIEEQGRHAASPEFGEYRYDDILQALARRGVEVVGEVREKDADPKAAAAHVVDGVKRLLDAGVPADHVTVVGASKGSVIAMLASTALQNDQVGWVLLADCNDSVTRTFELALHGQVLSIYESSDEVGGTCAPLFAQSPALAKHDEVRLSTGLRHGFLYRPLTEWVEPTMSWALRRTR